MADVIREDKQSSSTALQARVNQLQWHRTIDLGDGFFTPGGKSLAICVEEARLSFDRVDLSGRGVLDIGARHSWYVRRVIRSIGKLSQ